MARKPTRVPGTHCQRGHAFTDENSVWANHPRGKNGRSRQCRACKNAGVRKRWPEVKIRRILGVAITAPLA